MRASPGTSPTSRPGGDHARSQGTLLELGERARSELRHLEVEALLERLVAANVVIPRDIGTPGIDRLPYRQGRHYTPGDHPQVTAAHVAHRASELEAAGRVTHPIP